MVAPLVAAAVTSAAVSTVAGIAGSISGAKADKKAAEQNAALTYAQRMEELRRKQYQDAQTMGTAVAGAYASNLQMSGSPKKYIDELRSEQYRQNAWAKYSAKKEKETILEGGRSPGLAASLIGQAASGISQGIGAYTAGTK